MTLGADSVEIMRFQRFLLGETNVRLPMYWRAIAEKVKPGDAVLDLGTGTGILAFFACLAGARRVYAVEKDPVVELARLLARENGFEDRIVFLDDSSDKINLPERVDIVITDTFGTCGLQGGGIESVIDVRKRLLKPGGQFIPASIDLFVVPVEAAAIYESRVDFWDRKWHGVDFSAVRRLAVNNRYPVRLDENAWLADPECIAHVDLCDVERAAFHGEVHPAVRRTGTLHGFCAWFSATLMDDVVLSNRPGSNTTNYAHEFFPVARPVPLDEGDRVEICIRSYDNVDWRWQVEVHVPNVAREPKARFDHSTFWGFPLSGSWFRKLASDYSPKLSPRGEAERSLLEWSDGRTPIAELKRLLLQRYPDLFKSEQDLSAFVADIVSRWT